MKKVLMRMLSLLLVVTMCMSTFGLTAFAAYVSDLSAPPLTLEQAADENAGTVTVTVKTNAAFTFMGASATIKYDKTAFSLSTSAITGADGLSLTKNVNADDGATVAITTDEDVEFATGDTFLTFVFTKVDGIADGEYSFVLDVTGWTNSNYGADTFSNSNTNAVTYTVGTTSTTGYTATMTTSASNNEVVSEGNINVNVAVSHSSDTVFNAGEIKLSYDSTKLTPNTTSLDSMVTDGTLSGYKVNSNELVIEDFGGDKTMPYTYSIPFTAAEVSTETTDTVTLSKAAFIHKDNADSSDLIDATKSPESLTVTIKVAMVNVTLTNSADSTATTTTTQKGVAYTFAPTDTANYTYSNVTATVGGQPVTVTDNGDGTFTIAADDVTGDIALTYTKTAKSYTVAWGGAGADDITDKPNSATYGQTLTVTLPADKAPSTEAGYTYGISAKIGETTVGSYDSNTRTLTINGTDITGDITITVDKTTQFATDVKITVDGDSGVSIEGVTGNTATVNIGKSVTLVLTEEAGYDYKVVDSNGNEVSFTDGKYTFTASVTETFTVTKTLDVSSVKITQYVQVDNYIVYLVTYDGTLADGKAPTYDGNVMFWSEKYDAYCWLEIDNALTEETAKSNIDAQTATASDVDYGMDINGTGTTDAADAQLVWNMYNAMYSNFDTVSMAQFLAADQNATDTDNWGLNVQDAQVIITAILNGNATI